MEKCQLKTLKILSSHQCSPACQVWSKLSHKNKIFTLVKFWAGLVCCRNHTPNPNPPGRLFGENWKNWENPNFGKSEEIPWGLEIIPQTLSNPLGFISNPLLSGSAAHLAKWHWRVGKVGKTLVYRDEILWVVPFHYGTTSGWPKSLGNFPHG